MRARAEEIKRFGVSYEHLYISTLFSCFRHSTKYNAEIFQYSALSVLKSSQ